mmetsp:Transcript_53561/g.100391  ORF Transcript_53561/g.100391 Transcript_53561/m.100391 type:complete len:165 (-) Transcript_53561:14-508(-)
MAAAQRTAGGKGQALALTERLASCGEALLEILATIPPTPSVPGGQAEAAMLRHHLSACGQFRQARKLCQDLKTEPYVVTPADKIYVNPSVVPLLLSTRTQTTQTVTAKASGPGQLPPQAKADLMTRLKRRQELCDSLSAAIHKDLAAILENRWVPEPPPKRLRT